ncbi:MAG: hypothetical protein IPM82_12265 [Saprospiraceae bacterium]|nr:hypothetical protein [Saprospiraceae bacterium]
MLLSVAFLSTGCGEDETTTDLAPIVSITAGPTPQSVVAGVGTTVTVSVEATKGTKALHSVTVYEGDTKLSLNDITLDGNPLLITTPTDVMTWDIGIEVQADAGKATYRIVVEDEGGLTDEATFEITVEEAIEETIEGVNINLWNQAGPVGTGAIDLDTGGGTGTNDVAAELRDMGIDSLAGSGDNWRRRIGGINGTEVRYVGNTSGSADFGAVASKEAIVALFDGGDDLITANTISTGNIDVWGTFKVSDVVTQGDVFAVYKSSSSTYYLVVVNSVTETTTLGDNDDHYNVSIKY